MSKQVFIGRILVKTKNFLTVDMNNFRCNVANNCGKRATCDLADGNETPDFESEIPKDEMEKPKGAILTAHLYCPEFEQTPCQRCNGTGNRMKKVGDAEFPTICDCDILNIVYRGEDPLKANCPICGNGKKGVDSYCDECYNIYLGTMAGGTMAHHFEKQETLR